jgi:Flp pilus assembly pilin Flp
MFQVLSLIQAKVFNPLRGEKGVVGFEYVMVLGAVCVAIVIAVVALATAAPGVVTAACVAIATVLGAVTC